MIYRAKNDSRFWKDESCAQYSPLPPADRLRRMTNAQLVQWIDADIRRRLDENGHARMPFVKAMTDREYAEKLYRDTYQSIFGGKPLANGTHGGLKPELVRPCPRCGEEQPRVYGYDRYGRRAMVPGDNVGWTYIACASCQKIYPVDPGWGD